MQSLPKNTMLLMLATGLTLPKLAIAQRSPYSPTPNIPPPAAKTAQVQITAGPALELFRNNEAIIRWTSSNPGGSDEHWAVIHYGATPGQLTHIAKGHIRLNRTRSYTTFRVRVPDLKPGTTYYYTVTSMNADGTEDNVTSAVYQFTAPNGA